VWVCGGTMRMRILFIGNSFTQRNDLPSLVAGLLEAGGGEPIETERVIANGASLRRHWNGGTARERLEAGSWDLVVLQEQSTLPIKNRARYHENVRLFHPLIQAQGARTALYLTWARRHAPESQRELDAAVDEIAGELDTVVVPVGPAWEQVLAHPSAPELYDTDGSHPSPAGSYLAACVFYAVLSGRSPEGLSAPRQLRLEGDELRVLQAAAWKAVERHPRARLIPR
jgi:hypothetical protein